MWKFNNSLLNDKMYVSSIKEKLENVKCQYATHVYNTEKLGIIY